MVNPQPERLSTNVAQLQSSVQRLQQTVRLMEEQRQKLIDQRRRRLAIIGGSFSLLVHLLILIYLGLIYRSGASGDGGGGATYELAILNQEELTSLEQTTFDQIETEALSFDQAELSSAELSAATPADSQLSAGSGSIPTLGGSGDGGGGDMGLGGGGGGGTSFFGISGKGTRFAYVVDISGSMGSGRRLEIAKQELSRSVDALPDYASFYVLLFSSHYIQPPNQKGWTRARKPVVRQFINWLSSVDPSGGTQPRAAFIQLFALESRPDVIYFLTDGEFSDITAEEIAEMNRKGKRAVIHTIQFGNRQGEEVMRRIAKLTGGVYRFVAAGED